MSHRSRFILDTGPLLDFFILCYQAETGQQWWARSKQLHALHTPSDCDRFRDFLARNPGNLLTSPGVIAELQRHIRDAEKHVRTSDNAFRERIWDIIHRELGRWQITEDTVSLLDMNLAQVKALGPGDVGLIELAKRSSKKGVRAVVLTIDRKLLKRCIEEDVSAEYVADVMAQLR